MIFFTAEFTESEESIKKKVELIANNFKPILAVVVMRHDDSIDPGYSIAFLQSDMDKKVYEAANPITINDKIIDPKYLSEQVARKMNLNN